MINHSKYDSDYAAIICPDLMKLMYSTRALVVPMVSSGDFIEAGTPIAKLQTRFNYGIAKAPASGIVIDIASNGTEIRRGDTLMILIDERAEASNSEINIEKKGKCRVLEISMN